VNRVPRAYAPDKTDEFTTKIEVKQRELEPWTAKISEKQSAIDVATSERDLLVEKATGAQTALEEARSSLKSLKEGDGSKQDEYEALKKEGVKVKRQLAEGESKIEVSDVAPLQVNGRADGQTHRTRYLSPGNDSERRGAPQQS
jgi:structural maintenance of chromosome 4